ncbi:MAG: GNAT family N-acetyltransferase [Candidatus Pacebacteria bacterium]|nr:GNAT family N-acetyltransferase [Candidatus Paceibacterota bacterium]
MTNPAILILYNEPSGAGQHARYAESDAGVLGEVDAVERALTELGMTHRVLPVRTLRDVGRALAESSESCVLNLVESLDSSADDACLIPALCTALDKPCPGNGTACQLLALNKWLTKWALRADGVPTPEGTVVPPKQTPLPILTFSGPGIVKPLCADAGEGIDATSVIIEPLAENLREPLDRIHREFGQPALVEQYVFGREFNVSILERKGSPMVLPLAEIDFTAFPSGMPRIVDYRAKWITDSFEFNHTPRCIPARVGKTIAQQLQDTALAAWNCLGCRDYARVDMRLSDTGEVFVIDVNPNPDISPDAGFAAALQAAGIEFVEFIRILLDNAGVPMQQQSKRRQQDAVKRLDMRRSMPRDRNTILELIQDTGVFHSYEIDVAREVLDDALADGENNDYQSYTALFDDTVAGWACFGPTPCTSGTFDLYWLAVNPTCHGHGIGTALLSCVEQAVEERAGRLIVAETSSRPVYKAARRFYANNGYELAASIADFYGPEDDKLMYVKPL